MASDLQTLPHNKCAKAPKASADGHNRHSGSEHKSGTGLRRDSQRRSGSKQAGPNSSKGEITMPLGILNNIPSLQAENELTLTSTALNNTLEQLA